MTCLGFPNCDFGGSAAQFIKILHSADSEYQLINIYYFILYGCKTVGLKVTNNL